MRNKPKMRNRRDIDELLNLFIKRDYKEVIRRAITILKDFESIELYIYLSKSLMACGEVSESKKYSSLLFLMTNENVESMLSAGNCFLGLEYFQEAKDMYNKVLFIDNINILALANLAYIEILIGNQDQA